MFAIEEYISGAKNPTKNPNYETKDDTLATLNLKLHAEIARGLVATMATLANE